MSCLAHAWLIFLAFAVWDWAFYFSASAAVLLYVNVTAHPTKWVMSGLELC